MALTPSQPETNPGNAKSGSATPGSLPVATFALAPALLPDLFPADVVLRLRQVAEIRPELVLTDFTSAASVAALARTQILLTGWTCPPLTADVLALAPRLRAVIHSAGTVKPLVTPAVYAAGILVSSAAQANALPVAEYTVAMLVLGMKRVFSLARRYSQGQPALSHRPGERSGLTGTTVGIVGASRIGRLVAQMLQPYGLRVLITDPHVPADELALLGAEPVELDELISRSDAVTIHAPELPETRHLIDARRLAMMRDGALLINTARGSLVDTEALLPHCLTGRLDAVLDVSDPEPLPADHPLLHLPNVLVTPHVAGSRGRELRRLGEFAVSEVERLLAGLPLQGLVHGTDLARIA